MEDLRTDKAKNAFKRKQNWWNFTNIIRKNWVKIVFVALIISIIIFPSFFGNLIGMWFNKLATSIIQNITY